MRSGFKELMPLPVKRGLKKLGGDINAARRKRRLSVAMMLERTGLSKATYFRVEQGDQGGHAAKADEEPPQGAPREQPSHQSDERGAVCQSRFSRGFIHRSDLGKG